MEYIRVTKENIEKEHICCAISSNKDIQVISKKNWLKERFDDGLVFLKSIERGKCFIEYIPAENAWNPIMAEGYMYIDCLWVAGSFKGNGYSTDLLNACIEDSKAKGKKGICILSAAKKKPFLADPKFLKYKDFTVCDEALVEEPFVFLAVLEAFPPNGLKKRNPTTITMTAKRANKIPNIFPPEDVFFAERFIK